MNFLEKAQDFCKIKRMGVKKFSRLFWKEVWLYVGDVCVRGKVVVVSGIKW